MDGLAAGAPAANVEGVRRCVLPELEVGTVFTTGVAPTLAGGCRFVTTQPPIASRTANPKRIGQRYFCSASGASIGTPSPPPGRLSDRKSTRLNSSHLGISYAV